MRETKPTINTYGQTKFVVSCGFKPGGFRVFAPKTSKKKHTNTRGFKGSRLLLFSRHSAKMASNLGRRPKSHRFMVLSVARKGCVFF